MKSVETAKIITISVAHLHPDTIAALDACRGDIPEGPSIAVRAEGFLVNTHFGIPDALERDFTSARELSLMNRYPDLVLIRALGRGLGADWVNLDQDGVLMRDILPYYEENGSVTFPEDKSWSFSLQDTRKTPSGTDIVSPSRATLEVIEAGQTPGLHMAYLQAPDSTSFLEEDRRHAADEFYEMADFGGHVIIDNSGWESVGDTWVSKVFVENQDLDELSISKTLRLEFAQESSEIIEAVFDSIDILNDKTPGMEM